ncbi:MAG: DUF4113 domain-containing protein [Burkholderiales bacterium]|nr:DUF4113 domain-containing protein [Burkholderiales bacterium]
MANAAAKGLRSIYAWERQATEQRDRAKLMLALDQVNDRFGKRTIFLGSSGLSPGADTWGMQQVRSM